MAEKKGGISVDTEHIFPVIKKWLYSEKEIFLREIVSNACDAVTKLRRLISLGDDFARNITEEKFKVEVELDDDLKTITVSDNGIGMTADEVEKYICQIALSGALDFIEKYEDEDISDNGIIGHFGLGFYSAFMVSSTIEVITHSYKNNETVKWVCNDDGSYEMFSCDEDESRERGTSIVMHINNEGEEYLNKTKLRDILNRYCAFMPVDIFLYDANESRAETLQPINEKDPLWLKKPSECTEDEYKQFYKKVFNDYKDPLFWVHIKADYPLNFKGILYFPSITNEYENHDGQIKLYYNQVFVADNIKGVVPDYFFMMRGILDCPELPLNVSRSYLQNSTYVTKISSHITKKVADKINSMFNLDRDNYSQLWNDIKVFVKYACLNDKKFYDRIKNAILYQHNDGGHITLSEYLECAKEKHENKVYYSSDKCAQASYISMFVKENIDVIILDHIIDAQFAQLIENTETDVKFCRVDSELPESLKIEKTDLDDSVIEVFKAIVSENTVIKIESIKDTTIPAILNVNEENRRFEDMMKMYSALGKESPSLTGLTDELILNANCPLVAGLAKNTYKERIAKQIYNLCLLSRRQLTPDKLNEFLSDSYNLLTELK